MLERCRDEADGAYVREKGSGLETWAKEDI